MAYIWKYCKNAKLLEQEDKDVQICLLESELEEFKQNIDRCISDNTFAFTIESNPLPLDSPYHIDAPASNFHLPNVSYKSLTICSSDQSKDQIFDRVALKFILTKSSLMEIKKVINAAQTYPSLYENILQLSDESEIKLVIWGSFEGKPVFF